MRPSRDAVFCAALIAALAGSALADDVVYYVRATGSDAKDGLTPAKAFKTIQKAVAACSKNGGGYTIYVGPGTYAEEVHIGDAGGAAAKSGNPTKLNRIVGDTTGAYTSDPAGAVIIDGGKSRDYGIYLDGRDYWRFDTLTFGNQGYANVMWQNAKGLGLYDSTVNVSPMLGIYTYRAADITIQRNNLARDSQSGYCIYAYSYDQPGSITIDANRFNLTGSLYLSKGYATGDLSSLYKQSASGGIGFSIGILAYTGDGNTKGDITITNNVGTDCLYGIYAYAYGGKSSVSVCNNTIVGCYYPMLVYSYMSGTCKMNNNITTDCCYPFLAYGYDSSGQILKTVSVNGLLQNNIAYPSTWDAYNPAVKNLVLNKDPKFAKPAEGDFSLVAGSAARDAGVADGAPAKDILGRARPADDNGDGVAVADLGAWEGGPKGHIKIISWWESSYDAGPDGYTPDRQRTVRSVTGTTTPTATSVLSDTVKSTTTVTGTTTSTISNSNTSTKKN